MGEGNKKKIWLIAIFLLFFIGGIAYISLLPKDEPPEYKIASPEEVVRQYFASWNNKNYPDMYAAISDGFKKIEPTAKDLRAFKAYAESQGIEGVNILSIKEISNDGATASVDYSIEFIPTNGKKTGFEGTFTLKYRQGDIIQGWKLIHPYGENIDNS